MSSVASAKEGTPNPEMDLTVEESLKKKQRDYVLLLVFMILSFVSITVWRKLPWIAEVSLLGDVFRAVTIGGWYVVLYMITANFYSNKWFRFGYAALLVFQTSFNAYVHREGQGVDGFTTAATIAYIANLVGFSVVFYILLKDIFSVKHHLIYSLLGASNIYFMIPVIFGYIFSLIAIYDPSVIDADPNELISILFRCFDLAWYTLAGIDFPGHVAEAVESIAILESISANLFIVFIIGRLMSK